MDTMTKTTPAPTEPAPYVPTLTFKLSSSCRVAAQLEAGTVRSLTRPDPDDWRRKCHVAGVRRNGDVVVCEDEFHDNYPECRVCHQEVGDVDELTDDRRCLDGEGCLERKRSAWLDSSRGKMWADVLQRAEAEKAENRAAAKLRRETDPHATPRASKGAATPRVFKAKPDTVLDRRCEHCGEPTKGGRFAAGHDAKLKGLLLEGGKNLDVEAVAELIVRGWVKENTRKTIRQWLTKPPVTVVEAQARVDALFIQAQALADSMSEMELLRKRVGARLGEEL